ncbi:hypothetical protein AAE250_21495 [Bacteroides sp. GD17]|jgi:hypothetical protein|uniref:hypothetical protein n=1 Tax=Bacteroides sp. GD17 TaxID=3139826 RepID=UPI0025F8A7F0|nr:hypothetical protein [uncultured Bacteroides sp.]
MANWLSIKSAAEKYGIAEEQIYELIRLRYISYSSLDCNLDDNSGPLVDTDEIDKLLHFNRIESFPDDRTIERVPVSHLNWLYKEYEKSEEINDQLLEDIRSFNRKEAILRKDLKSLASLANQITSLSAKMTKDMGCVTRRKDKKIWSFLNHLFKRKKVYSANR